MYKHKYPSHLRMPSCLQKVVYIYKFIVLSAVAALAVSLSRQNGKSCDGSKEERTRSLARKQRRQRKCSLNDMKSALRTMSMRERERAAAPSEANQACGRLDKRPYPAVRNVLANSFNVMRTLRLLTLFTLRSCTCMTDRPKSTCHAY